MPKIGRTAGIALGFIALGFIVIGMAWNGAASEDCIQCQFPYLLSGGVTGIGFILLGGGLLLFESWRRTRVQLEQKLDAVIEAVRGGETEEAPAEPADAKPARGKGRPSATARNGLVVVGRSSFHRPDCRLVAGKEDMDVATAEEATERGLSPCRVCEPVAVAR